MKLVIGNKNYSSWSLRAYLALRLAEVPFEEVFVPLNTPSTASLLAELTPAMRVPALTFASGECVWDSLAIGEWAAENSRGPALWPQEASARAFARSAVAEMHAGFASLRSLMPMDIRNTWPQPSDDALTQDINRVLALWEQCRREFGGNGDFLFGPPTLADCFYAPVVSRFRTYAVKLPPVAEAYAQSVARWQPFVDWSDAAAGEPWEIDQRQAGTPVARAIPVGSTAGGKR